MEMVWGDVFDVVSRRIGVSAVCNLVGGDLTGILAGTFAEVAGPGVV